MTVVSLWELIVKKNRKDAPVGEPLAWWARHVSRAEIELDRLPEIHRDPFDRMLVAQARAEELRLMTADDMLGRYNVETVW